MELIAYTWIATFAVWSAWDVGRRFSQARGNADLDRRVRVLEQADTSLVSDRLADVETLQTGLKNQIETMRAKHGTRWGA